MRDERVTALSSHSSVTTSLSLLSSVGYNITLSPLISQSRRHSLSSHLSVTTSQPHSPSSHLSVTTSPSLLAFVSYKVTLSPCTKRHVLTSKWALSTRYPESCEKRQSGDFLILLVLRIKNFMKWCISRHCFQKIWWQKKAGLLIPLYQVLSLLQLHGRVAGLRKEQVAFYKWALQLVTGLRKE